MNKLLILSEHALEYKRLIEATNLSDLELVVVTNPTQAVRLGQDCNLAFGEPSFLSQALPYLPGLEWIQATWAGVEPLLDHSLRRDYQLTNARGVFGRLMAEYVFAYMLAHERRILSKFESQIAGLWDVSEPGSLRGKHIGLLGVGSIGSELAKTARHFDMIVSGYTRSSESCPDVHKYYHGNDLLQFASDLDYLVNILPGVKETVCLVGSQLLAALPTRAVFISVGRGSVVDEAALVHALRNEIITAAVLDVFHEEPLSPGHDLWRLPNVLITSHTSALSYPADIARLFIENYTHFSRGETLIYRVDFNLGY